MAGSVYVGVIYTYVLYTHICSIDLLCAYMKAPDDCYEHWKTHTHAKKKTKKPR